MGEIGHIYIFGDETFDYGKHLHHLVHQQDDPLVRAFTENVYYALRAEIGRLPQRQQQEFGRFASFAELTAQRLDGPIHPALDQALSCAYHLARFISKYGQEWSYPKAANSYVIGICSGALAAAAVCSSTTFSNLLGTAVHSVVVSFRTGLRSMETGVGLASSKDLQESWSMLVPRLNIEDATRAIESFSESKHLPATSRPFVSACSNSGVTISGPPAVLDKFRSSAPLSALHPVSLPLKTPYHAPHLFNQNDVDDVLSTTSAEDWEAQFAAIPTISSSTGDFIWASNFRSLLRDGVNDILSRSLRWDKICQRLRFIAGSTRGMPVVVHQIGLSADNTIRTALQQGGCDSPLILDQSRSLLPPDLLTSSALKLRVASQNLSSGERKAKVDRSKIAIVGTSGRFPDAESLSAYWDLLIEGRDVHKEVPPLHWDAKTHVDPTGKAKNTSATPFGCWLDHPELFDSKFFNISPREAPQVDPAQRIALLTAYEAMEQAGIVPAGTPSTQKDRVGVFYGVTSNDWMETNSAQAIDAYHIPGGNRAFIPGRINYCFNFSGPSYSVDTACSSSLATIHVSCNALWRGEIDTAIAGGTNILTNPDFTAGLDRGRFLSRTGNCKTFDDEADGYCRGEGVGTVILKRLEDALFDKDPILGVIAGVYTNHSAEAESITRPFVGAQEDVFRKILSGAGVDPYEIGYVEMHGTGTQAGDGSEARSVLGTFAPDNGQRRRNEDQDLYIGSAKANIGHGEAASGVSSLIKVLLMMEKNMIPPHCGIKTRINHTFPTNLDERRVNIAKTPTAWKRTGGKPRKAFINNFSAAGGNTALLVEDAPFEPVDRRADSRSTHVVAVSAKSASSLQGNLTALISAIDQIAAEDLPRLSWTTTARRMHHQHRVMVSGSDLSTVKANLQKALETKEGSKRPPTVPKVAFAFTGQGSGYAGMGADLFEACGSFQSDIKSFDKIATSLGFPSFLPFLTQADVSEPSPVVSQLATVCLEIALARLWISWGVTPLSVTGHSLGHYSALNVSGVLSNADTIYLVGNRAQLLEDRCPPGTHSMLAVRTNLKPGSNSITKILKNKQYEVACINSPEEFVISGSGEEIRGCHQRLSDSNIKATLLSVPYAFHSAQVEPILEDFEKAAEGVVFHNPTIPVLDPLDASVVNQKGHFNPRHLAQHCRQTVNFMGAVTAAKTNGVVTDKSIFLELGPHPVVSVFLKAMIPTASALPSLKRRTNVWQVVTQTLSGLYAAGADIQWREYHRDFQSCQKVLRLPNYSWDLKGYWMQYVNDWSLRKGDPPLVSTGSPSEPFPEPLAKPLEEVPVPKVEIPKLESSTLHQVVEESMTGRKGSIKVRSDISRSDMNPLVQGHKVNGVPLCTPSVYADMGLSLGDYIKKRYWTQLDRHNVVVADMVIEKALIAAPKGPQYLQANVELDGELKSAKCTFHTVDGNGRSKMQHANCTIRFSDPDEVRKYQEQVPKARSRISELRKKLATQETYVFNKAMIYKMIATLADFDPKYRALDEVVLDSAAMEATSLASFGNIRTDGKFHTNPGYIDALSQSGGFVMNANDKSNLNMEVFVNHGWEAFQLFEKLSPTTTYQSHVVMSEGTGKMWHGDILILDGDKVVAVFKSIALQGVASRLLNYILSSESTAQTGVKSAKDSSPTPSKGGSPQQSQQATKSSTQPGSSGARPASAASTAPAAPTKPAPTPIVEEPKSALKKAAPRKNKVTKKVTKKVGGTGESQTVKKAMQIVSEESGIDTEDLVDGAVLSDIGIDSLLGLMISSRFKDEIGVDIDSSTLHALETVKGLRLHLGQVEPSQMVEEEGEEEVEEEVEEETEEVEDPEDTTHIPRGPVVIGSNIPLKANATNQKSKPIVREENVYVAPPRVQDSATAELLGKVSDMIAEESGMDVEDLTDDTVFIDVGIDSLLSLMICSRLRDELGVEAAADNTIFTTCQTMKELKTLIAPDGQASSESQQTTSQSAAVDEGGEIESVGSSSDTDDSSIVNVENVTPSTPPEPGKGLEEKPVEMAKVSAQLRKATSVILQGRPWASSKTLFLFPDGAGSASSYTNLPKVHPDLAIIALNCPFVRHPQEMTVPLDELMQTYLDEVRRRQPAGPYNFGGWSAGGILAYRAAQILIEQGEQVESLVLIDSPVPKGLDRLPQRFYDHLATIDLFGKAMPGAKNPGPPAHLFQHFNATIETLHDYHAKPLPRQALERVTILWATECVTDGVILPKLPSQPDDTEGMKFLTEKRTDFTAQGWAGLFPGVSVEVAKIDDAHHFSMMQHMPQAQMTSGIIRKGVGL